MTVEAEAPDGVNEDSQAEANDASEVPTNDMSLADMRAELEKWRNKANESIDTRQRAKEKARNYEQENRELKRKLQEKEKAEEAARREKLVKKERYDELIKEVEEERKTLHSHISGQLQKKQFEDLYNKVLEEGGLDPSNEFVIRATLSQIANDLDLIEEVDASDIATVSFREADKKSVAAALRQLRKLAPAFFGKGQAGGDVPRPDADNNKPVPNGYKSPSGASPDDPRLAAVLKAARGG